MQKKKRRKLYRTLTRMLGNPATFSDAQRQELRRILDGWRGQYTKQAPLSFEVRINLASPRADSGPHKDILATDGWLGRHLTKSWAAFGRAQAPGHWSFKPVCRLPKMVVKDKKRWKIERHEVVGDWAHIRETGHKQIEVAISPSYHLTVAREGVARDGRKIVQAIWDCRDYDDIQVWQCRYWDFSCINHDKGSWARATQHEGYVAKTGTHVSVKQEFGDAMQSVRRRTVGHAIRSIIKDAEVD